MNSSRMGFPADRKRLRWIGIPIFAAVLLLSYAGNLLRSAATPVRSLDETGMADSAAGDFDALHSPVESEAGEFLIFGNLLSKAPAADLPAEYAAFLGRWEGYSYGPPVNRDWKYVFAVREVSREGGRASLWAGANLQYPAWIKDVDFRFVQGNTLRLEWQYAEDEKAYTWTWTYDSTADVLRGWRTMTSTGRAWGPVELGRGRSFHVYRDYPAYLAGKRIYPVAYRDDWLSRYFGSGFLLYLPDGYGENPTRSWPLIFFLHGSGDRGDNVFLLVKASPLMMILEAGPLPFLIVAPLLGNSGYYASFPEAYLDGVLEQALADYRVDRARIYGTGISIGGEGLYRYAVHRPDLFAAIAPLSAYLSSTAGLERLAGLPVRAIHGDQDPIISLSRARQDVEALIGAGADVSFVVLENHDHDTWTDTYRDPRFYEWLLLHAGG
jgi:predicted esterase